MTVLPFEVGGLEVLLVTRGASAAAATGLAAVNANEDEQEESQNGTDDDGDKGFLGDVIWSRGETICLLP